MNAAAPASKRGGHAALMDTMYRHQRHIYDLTRKYYLFGRDKMIRELDCRPGDKVLEIGCGTGRNLAKVARRWEGVTLYGLDISAEMLKSAQATLGEEARLAQGDATSFDAHALFGHETFDRVFISFALSMIPEWCAALDRAASLVAPGGALIVVDFGDMKGLWPLPRAVLRGWLDRFHVAPRIKLPDIAAGIARRQKLRLRTRRGPFGYFTIARLESTAPRA